MYAIQYMIKHLCHFRHFPLINFSRDDLRVRTAYMMACVAKFGLQITFSHPWIEAEMDFASIDTIDDDDDDDWLFSTFAVSNGSQNMKNNWRLFR